MYADCLQMCAVSAPIKLLLNFSYAFSKLKPGFGDPFKSGHCYQRSFESEQMFRSPVGIVHPRFAVDLSFDNF